jgi:putative spermidine/putrescine transport system substrate-binding protein
MDRRTFLYRAGGVAGLAATSLTACDTGSDRESGSRGKGRKTLVVRDSGGTYGAANRKRIYDPFTEETGIRVEVVNTLDGTMLAQIKEGRPRFDVMDIDMVILARFEKEGATEELDYDRLNHAKDAGIAKSLLTSYGVGKNYWANVMAYRTDAFDGKKPETWADFWDTKAFPGKRAMQGEDFPELEFALLADGVSMHKLYPLDVDRAFKSLDRIKDSVRRYWEDGAEPAKLLGGREVAASTVWSGRLQPLMERGAPVVYQWNGARRQSNGYGIPKGSANPDAAYRLIDFALRPEVQASTAKSYPLGPVVPVAYTDLTERATMNLASTPGHLASGFNLDVDWWLDNWDAVMARWRKWVRS